MKKTFCITLLVMLLSCIMTSTAQQSEQEKLLLTLDRTNYVPGDYIWFSGFILSAEEHVLLANEYILHLCLYDPNGTLVTHNLYPIKKGTFKGHVELPKTTKKGLYRITAYTNWMQNWGDNSLLQKAIWVNGEKSDLNFSSKYEWKRTHSKDTLLVSFTMDKSGDSDFSFLNVTSKLQTPKGKPITENLLTSSDQFKVAIPVKKSDLKDSLKLKLEVADASSAASQELLIRLEQQKPDVQFLPESGNLISGYNQLIAFKAIGSNGFPINIEGKVFDQNDNVVADIETIHDGMGSFYITPEYGANYYAKIENSDNQTYTYKLPEVLETGVSLRVTSTANLCKIKIMGNKVTKSLVLKVHSRGQQLAEQKINNIPSEEITYDRNSFPAGIIHFTLVTLNNQPLCERLIFKAPAENINVSFPLEKSVYAKRDSVLLPVKVTQLNANQLALYNISVIDQNYHHNYLGGNAVTDLLLTSELPGFIGNPTYYIMQSEAAKQASDLLMLTNGWCRFNWQDISQSSDKFDHEREATIYLKGQLRHILTNKPLKNNFAQGLFYAPGQSVRKTSTSDNNGNFIFKFPDIDFDLTSTLKFAKKDGGKPREVKATIESLKEVKQFDMVKANSITSSKNKAPEMPLIESSHLKLDKAPISNLNKYIPGKPREDNYFTVGMDTIVLKELEVSKQRLLNNRENMRALFGTPKKVVTDKQVLAVADEIPWYSSIWDLLEFLFPELDIASYRDREGLAEDDPIKYRYVYGVRHVNNHTKPVFVVLNGRRIYAHENPRFFSHIVDISNQLEWFKTLNPSLITSVELYDAANNYNSYMGDYETELLGYTYDADYDYNDLIITNRPTSPPYILSITTTGGTGAWGNEGSKEMRVKVHGFEPLKTPYSPKYNVPESDSIIYDGRKTLCWKPIVVSKNEAIKSFNFYTGDTDGEKLVMVNGISSDGIPFYGTTSITVKGETKTETNLNPEQKHKRDVITKFREASKHNITTNGVTLKCVIQTDNTPVTNLLLKSDKNRYLTTNSEGEVHIDKGFGNNVTISGIGILNRTINLSQVKTDSLLVSLTKVEPQSTTDVNRVNQLVRSAITVSAKQMPKNQIRRSFFREKVYKNKFLVSLEEWDLKSKLFSYGLYRDEAEVAINKGKSYKTFDYREKIKATPNKRDVQYAFSTDPLYVRKPFLDPTYMKYYNYSATGETTLDNKTCIEVLFDVKAELYMPGYRGKLIIDKNSHMIMAVKYAISPTNRDYLDDSYFIHDNPGRFDVELTKSVFFARYNTEVNNYYPLITYEKIDFLVNRTNQQSFIRETLFNGILPDSNFKTRSEDEANRNTYLVKNPMYDKAIFNDINIIKLPHSDLKEIPFLHEISKFD